MSNSFKLKYKCKHTDDEYYDYTIETEIVNEMMEIRCLPKHIKFVTSTNKTLIIKQKDVFSLKTLK